MDRTGWLTHSLTIANRNITSSSSFFLRFTWSCIQNFVEKNHVSCFVHLSVVLKNANIIAAYNYVSFTKINCSIAS